MESTKYLLKKWTVNAQTTILQKAILVGSKFLDSVKLYMNPISEVWTTIKIFQYSKLVAVAYNSTIKLTVFLDSALISIALSVKIYFRIPAGK